MIKYVNLGLDSSSSWQLELSSGSKNRLLSQTYESARVRPLSKFPRYLVSPGKTDIRSRRKIGSVRNPSFVKSGGNDSQSSRNKFGLRSFKTEQSLSHFRAHFDKINKNLQIFASLQFQGLHQLKVDTGKGKKNEVQVRFYFWKKMSLGKGRNGSTEWNVWPSAVDIRTMREYLQWV